jgi:xylulose-5-phosphate/fructose-6-phosphate phosphoketolase
VPLPAAKTSSNELAELQSWLSSYDIGSLIDPKTGHVSKSILDLVPKSAGKRLGQRKEAYAGYTPLHVPNWLDSGLAVKSGTQASCMIVVGKFLDQVMQKYIVFPTYVALISHVPFR